MITSKKAELDQALTDVLGKIDAGKITCEDLNCFIHKALIGETTPEAVRDRVRRRTTQNATDSHIEPQSGHQPLVTPQLASRVQPKRQPMNQQNHGRAAIAHRHSARTQTMESTEPTYWEYQCPKCEGKAYNGIPESGNHFRGSAKCRTCGGGFGVVHVQPLRKDVPASEIVGVNRYQPAVEFIQKHQGQPISESLLVASPPHLKALATKLMLKPGFNRDWLFELVQKLD
jgi:hypothetical protein